MVYPIEMRILIEEGSQIFQLNEVPASFQELQKNIQDQVKQFGIVDFKIQMSYDNYGKECIQKIKDNSSYQQALQICQNKMLTTINLRLKNKKKPVTRQIAPQIKQQNQIQNQAYGQKRRIIQANSNQINQQNLRRIILSDQANCQIHNLPSNQICTTCHIQLCNSCQHQNNLSCNIQQNNEALQYYQNIIQSLNLQEIAQKQLQLADLKKNYQQNLDSLEKQYKDFQDKTNQFQNQIIALINDIRKRNTTEIEKKKQALKQEIDAADKYLASITKLMNLKGQQGNLFQLATQVKEMEVIQKQNINVQQKYKLKIDSPFQQQKFVQLNQILDDFMSVKITNELEENLFNQKVQQYGQGYNTAENQYPNHNFQPQYQQISQFQAYQVPLYLQPINQSSGDIEITNEQLQQAGLEQNDLYGLKKTITHIKELSPGTIIDVKKLCQKYNLSNKNPEEASYSYAFG